MAQQLSLEEILRLIGNQPGQIPLETLSPGVEAMKQAPLGSAGMAQLPAPGPGEKGGPPMFPTPGAGGGGGPQLANASMPTQQPDMLTQLTQQMDPKMIEQVIGQLQKDTLNTKSIGPDLMGQGGLFGIGIQPTDVLGFALGALLTRGLPTDQAIGRTMQMATLPAQFRQQQRENLQKMLGQIMSVAGAEQQMKRPIQVAGGYMDPQSHEVTRTQPLAKHELAIQSAQTPEELGTALGYNQAPPLPGVAGRRETEIQTAREPFEVKRESRRIAGQREMEGIRNANRERIVRLGAALRNQDATALQKNINAVEKRIGRPFTEDELMKLLVRSSGGNPLDQMIADALRGSGGGGLGAPQPATPGGNLSPEAQELLRGRR